MAATHGGARQGAGRKPTREKYAAAVSKAERKIADNLPEVVDLMFELARGVTVKEVADNGESKVYERPPDFKAVSYLLDRILGKPVTPVEGEMTLSGNADKPLAVKIVRGVSMDDL